MTLENWTPIENRDYPQEAEDQFLVRLEVDGEDGATWAEAWIEGGSIVTQWSHSELGTRMRITHWMHGPSVDVG